MVRKANQSLQDTAQKDFFRKSLRYLAIGNPGYLLSVSEALDRVHLSGSDLRALICFLGNLSHSSSRLRDVLSRDYSDKLAAQALEENYASTPN